MFDMNDFRRPILKESRKGLATRIFRPYELDRILSYGCLKLYHKTMFLALLYSGMRYGFIHLPSYKASRKHKRKQPDRWVRLNNQGKQAVEYFLDLDRPLPDYNGWNANLKCWCKRAELDSAGVSVKTTRKTWESWLLFTFPTRVLDIVGSQGHTTTVSIQHYCNMPFTEEDKVGIKRYTEGWING